MQAPATELPLEPTAPPRLLAPVGEGERLFALDVLRGVAVLGILVLNIQAFSMIGAAYMNPNAYGSLEGANGWVWRLSHVLGDQKFWTIFSMLFGAGIVLMTSRAEAKGRGAAGLHYRRMGWLILFGLLHAHLLWFGDILYTYGMCGLLLYLFRKLPPAGLIACGVALICVASATAFLFGWSMQYWPEDQVRELADEAWLPVAEIADAELAAYRGGWLEQMRSRVPDAVFFETFLFLLGGIGAKTGGVALIGMALYKLGVLTASRSVRFYLGLALVGLGAGLPIVEFGVRQNIAHGWEIMYSFFLGGQYNLWASLLVSLGYVGIVMSIVKLGVLGLLMRTLAAVGRMALTNYLMQSIICTTIFYGHGFGRFGHLERVEQIQVVAAVSAAQLLWSPIWLAYFRFGPFEWLWRSSSYWKRQPFLR